MLGQRGGVARGENIILERRQKNKNQGIWGKQLYKSNSVYIYGEIDDGSQQILAKLS